MALISVTGNRSDEVLRVSGARIPVGVEKRASTRSDNSRLLRAMGRHEPQQPSGRGINEFCSTSVTPLPAVLLPPRLLQRSFLPVELAKLGIIVDLADDLATDDPETVQVTTNSIR